VARRRRASALSLWTIAAVSSFGGTYRGTSLIRNTHPPRIGCRVRGSGFRVQGAGFRVQGAGFRVQGALSRWTIAAISLFGGT